MLVRGVYIDAEEPAGQCVIFPVYYIRLFFQKERTKKQNRLTEKHEKSEQNNTVLLIEKTQMNHSAASGDVKVKTKIKNMSSDSENDSCENNNEKSNNDEHKILCEDE